MQANTLVPHDVQTENMMETTKFDVTDGRLTAQDDVNEVYPDGQNYVDFSLQDSWANKNEGIVNSPFMHQTQSSKSKQRSYASTKSKISTYRQRYYDQINMSNDVSIGYVHEKGQTMRQPTGINNKRTR